MSQRKSETARLNGSKSKGPKTPQGKARSAMNALRHGLTASFRVLDHESEEEFEAFLDAYLDRYQPADVVELELVQTMAATRWRMRRVAAIESDLFGNELALSQEDIDNEFDEISDDARLAWVFNKLAGESKALALLMRYETNLNRLYERTAKQLRELQSSVPPNEPTGPITSDSPSTSEQEGTAEVTTPVTDSVEAPRNGTVSGAELVRPSTPTNDSPLQSVSTKAGIVGVTSAL